MPASLENVLEGLPRVIVEASKLYEPTRRAVEEGAPGGPAIVVAFGKGAPAMARAAVDALGDRVEGGVIVYPRWMNPRLPEGLEAIPSSHPVPDEASVRAGEAVVEWAERARSGGTSLIVLVSGGGSALVELPRGGLSIGEVAETTRLLLSSGASIHEVNTVRKHLSLVKGGWLARHAHPAPLLGVYASDVPGDRLDVIASGPTVPDPTTFQDALRVLDYWGLRGSVPKRVVDLLERGARGLEEETPKPGDPAFERARNMLAAYNLMVLRRLEAHLERLGYRVLVLTSRLEGESREVGRALASVALEAWERGVPGPAPLAVVAGGETTVSVRGRGRGGRNQELVLAFAIAVDYWAPEGAPIGVLAMDTDGVDGASDAAGAYAVGGDTRRMREAGVDPREALAENDSYRALASIGRLVRTGPIESNLNSVVVVLVGAPESGALG